MTLKQDGLITRILSHYLFWKDPGVCFSNNNCVNFYIRQPNTVGVNMCPLRTAAFNFGAEMVSCIKGKTFNRFRQDQAVSLISEYMYSTVEFVDSMVTTTKPKEYVCSQLVFLLFKLEDLT